MYPSIKSDNEPMKKSKKAMSLILNKGLIKHKIKKGTTNILENVIKLGICLYAIYLNSTLSLIE